MASLNPLAQQESSNFDFVPAPKVTTRELTRSDGSILVADVYTPATPRAAVIYLHGGAWVMGSRTDYGLRLQKLAAQGFLVVSIDYRLAGQAPYPAQREDIEVATNWLISEEPAASGKIITMGASAGAHLAALAALTSEIKYAGFVGMFGRYDLTAGAAHLTPEPGTSIPDFIRTTMPPPNVDPVAPEYRLVRLAGVASPADLDDSVLTLLSPISYVSSDSPPMLLFHGQEDGVTDFRHALHFAQQARKMGASCEVTLIPHANHEDDRFAEVAYIERIARFIDATPSTKHKENHA